MTFFFQAELCLVYFVFKALPFDQIIFDQVSALSLVLYSCLKEDVDCWVYIIRDVQLMEIMRKYSVMGLLAGVWISMELNGIILDYINQKYPTAQVSPSEQFQLIQYILIVYQEYIKFTADKSPSKAIKHIDVVIHNKCFPT